MLRFAVPILLVLGGGFTALARPASAQERVPKKPTLADLQWLEHRLVSGRREMEQQLERKDLVLFEVNGEIRALSRNRVERLVSLVAFFAADEGVLRRFRKYLGEGERKALDLASKLGRDAVEPLLRVGVMAKILAHSERVRRRAKARWRAERREIDEALEIVRAKARWLRGEKKPREPRSFSITEESAKGTYTYTARFVGPKLYEAQVNGTTVRFTVIQFDKKGIHLDREDRIPQVGPGGEKTFVKGIIGTYKGRITGGKGAEGKVTWTWSKWPAKLKGTWVLTWR